MFGKLPNLFDKNFAIGYFLPIMVFFTLSLWLLSEFGLLSKAIVLSDPNKVNKLIGITIAGLLSWLGGIFLLGANREVLRLMEGYGRFNPTRILSWLERRRYHNLQKAKLVLDEQYIAFEDRGEELPHDIIRKRNKILRDLALEFPDAERWLLPTSFGNTIRAFESYPRIMYGLDPIEGWSRLVMVIPKDYYLIVNDAKSIVDFWGNLWFLSWVIVFEYVTLALYKGTAHALWFPISAIAISFFVFWRAKVAALGWGELVKASFDVFLPALNEKLGYPIPQNRDEEKGLWRNFSQAIIYRSPNEMPARKESENSQLKNKN